MKRFILVLFGLFMILQQSYAGDIPEALMEGNQKALLIGRIIEQDLDTTVIKIDVLLMGSVKEESLKIDRITRYYGINQLPKKDDIIVVVLQDDNEIDRNWIFKADSNNYQELNLITEEYNMTERYENYINSGSYFDAQMKIDKVIGENNLKHALSIDYVYDSNLPSTVLMFSLFVIMMGIGYLIFFKKVSK